MHRLAHNMPKDMRMHRQTRTNTNTHETQVTRSHIRTQDSVVINTSKYRHMHTKKTRDAKVKHAVGMSQHTPHYTHTHETHRGDK